MSVNTFAESTADETEARLQALRNTDGFESRLI